MSRANAVCTIVARNYIAQARVLARSFELHHPDVAFYTLLIDGDESDRSRPALGRIVLPRDLGVSSDVIDDMQVMYDVMEYATALKPAMLMHLYRSGAATATYFDPDIRIYGRLDDVFETAAARGIFLTPHALQPIPRDRNRLTEADIMHSGMYNLGFISTGPSAYRFLAWWHDRLKTDAIVDLANALFTDQRWIDWAPAIEHPFVTRDRGLNAAYWNLHERSITRTDDGRWMAGGDELRFFHFSGYDPASPWLLSKHMGARPRTLLSEHEGLKALCDEYGADLVEMGHVRLRKNPYRNTHTPDGLKLTHAVRRLYRDSVLGRGPDTVPAPNPLRDPAGFRQWLLEPSLAADSFRMSRFELAIWNLRTDLQRAFPDPLGSGARDYRSWLEHDAGAEVFFRELGYVREPVKVHARGTEAPVEDGWSIVGYAHAELGVGEAGRRLSQVFSQTGVPWEMVAETRGPESRQAHRYQGAIADKVGFANTLLCVNADQTELLIRRLALAPTSGKRIGYWFWELADFPARFDSAFSSLDEVWVASEFNRAAIAARTDIPVHIVPLPIPIPSQPTRFTRAQLSLPEEAKIFLVSFDYLSVMARKNPIGAIEAYTDAFSPTDGACLVIKSINGYLRPIDRERLRLAAAGRPDILLLDGYMSANEMRGLVELVDCVVSLHRAEGYGLNLADAMAVGTPVVATGYSGNLAYMNDETAFLVPYSMVSVGAGADPYPERSEWADPDLAKATDALRLVFDSPDVARATADRALNRVREFSPARLAADLLPQLLQFPSLHALGKVI